MVLADPQGSILADYVNTGVVSEDVGSWLVEGIGEDFVPPVSDFSRVKRAYTVTDAEAFDTVRTLLKREGIFAGTSSGTLIAAALRYCREQTEAEARGDLRVRQRQQVPVQVLQRLLDDGPGLPGA